MTSGSKPVTGSQKTYMSYIYVIYDLCGQKDRTLGSGAAAGITAAALAVAVAVVTVVAVAAVVAAAAVAAAAAMADRASVQSVLGLSMEASSSRSEMGRRTAEVQVPQPDQDRCSGQC